MYVKKGCRSQWSILDPKGIMGTVVMSDNALKKGCYCKISANSNK